MLSDKFINVRFYRSRVNRVSKDSLGHMVIIASERGSRTKVSGSASRSQIGDRNSILLNHCILNIYVSDKSQHKQPRARRRSVTGRIQASTWLSPRRRSRAEVAGLSRRYPIHYSRVASLDFDKIATTAVSVFAPPSFFSSVKPPQQEI